MTTIHLLGSEGFIGRAMQREAGEHALHCWSHQSSDPSHHFDLLDSSTWESLLSTNPSHVILLAWPGIPNYQETFHVTRNLPASIALIEQLAEAGLKRLVVAGTCYEYGMQNGPLREDQLVDPLNCYAIAKDALRRVMSTTMDSKRLQWCWLRIFYPYGEGQNPRSLLPSLTKAIQKGDQTFAMSSGRQIRDFIHVDQVARQLLALASCNHAFGIYNGGSGWPRSLLEIAEATIETHKSPIRLKKGALPDRSDEPLAFWADMGKFHLLHNSSS
jgi:dTDP-6-deoxy-L-talose 4-dehydrogenase (NAD+)